MRAQNQRIFRKRLLYYTLSFKLYTFSIVIETTFFVRRINDTSSHYRPKKITYDRWGLINAAFALWTFIKHLVNVNDNKSLFVHVNILPNECTFDPNERKMEFDYVDNDVQWKLRFVLKILQRNNIVIVKLNCVLILLDFSIK